MATPKCIERAKATFPHTNFPETRKAAKTRRKTSICNPQCGDLTGQRSIWMHCCDSCEQLLNLFRSGTRTAVLALSATPDGTPYRRHTGCTGRMCRRCRRGIINRRAGINRRGRRQSAQARQRRNRVRCDRNSGPPSAPDRDFRRTGNGHFSGREAESAVILERIGRLASPENGTVHSGR